MTALSSARGLPPSHAFSVSAAPLALLRASENDTAEDDNGDDIVVFGALFATSSAIAAIPPWGARPTADGGERCCCSLLKSGSGVPRNKGDPPMAPFIILVVRAEHQLGVRLIAFRKGRHGPRRADRADSARSALSRRVGWDGEGHG